MQPLAQVAERAGATWLPSPCLGLCERAPAAMLTVAGPTPRAGAWGPVDATACVDALTSGHAPAPAPSIVPQRGRDGGRYPERLLARVGTVDPTSLDAYRAAGGYGALRRALERGPAFVLREVADSGLVGRGGAAFPTGRKWAAVAAQPGRTKYVVCNADESEPGTFKDRVLMEEDPFALVEAMTIAGTTVGAEHGFIYLRGEYPLARARLAGAIAAAYARGLLGADLLGHGVRFDLELRLGAGAYICGEETALFASLEGYRGEPRTKPPFPVEVGLFGRPTVVNNVETLVNVLGILAHGAPAYRAVGTAASPSSPSSARSAATEPWGWPRTSRVISSSWRTVPTRHGTHWPQLSSRKNCAMRASTGPIGTVRSSTSTTPEPSVAPAARVSSKVSGSSRSAAPTNVPAAPPSSTAAGSSAPARSSSARSVTPNGSSYRPGRATLPLTQNSRVPGEPAVPSAR